MESLQFPGVSDSAVVKDEQLVAFRKSLINLSVKTIDPSTDHIQAYLQLKEWLLPLVDAGAQSTVDGSYQTLVIDVLSIVFKRLAAIHKRLAYGALPLEEKDILVANKFLSLFRDHFDQASSSLLKSIKDALTSFIIFGTEAWGLENTQAYSETVVREIFVGSHGGSFRKSDLYLAEYLLKKKWLTSTPFFFQGAPILEIDSLLKAMDNRALAPSIGRFVGSLLRCLQTDLAADKAKVDILKNEWLEFFKANLANALLSPGEQLALNTELYVIPGVFHDDKEGFAAFIKYLLGILDGSEDQHRFIAIIGCLRTGKELGWLTEDQVDQYISLLGGYSTLLSHSSGFIRALTLRLMILSSTSALALPSSYISILKEKLDDLFAESDPKVRTEVYSGLRTLLERLVASSYSLNKRLRSLETRAQIMQSENVSETKTLQDQLDNQRVFISWFVNDLLSSQLRPNASYQRVILALRVYSFWLPQLDNGSREPNTVPTNTLAPDVKLSKKKQNEKEHIVLPFDPAIDFPSLVRLLVERIMDPYDDIRTLASGLVKQLRQIREVPWGSILQRAQKMIEESGRPGQEDGFSRLIEVLYDISLQDSTIIPEVLSLYSNDIPTGSTIIDLVFFLLENASGGRVGGPEKPKSKIDNSILGALALIYKRKDAALLFNNSGKQSRCTLDKVFDICNNIWAQEKSILCNESPEGRGVSRPHSGIEDESDEEEEDQLNSQGFLSYSWRVVSEASSLLGGIAEFSSTGYPTTAEADEFLRRSGELLIEQLTSIRHRGSLSSIFPALTAVCHQCLISQSEAAEKLPQLWLEKLLSIISSSGKLITRRSAGLPMALGAILISEVQTKRKKCIFLDQTFKSLQGTVETSEDSTSLDNDRLELPQVHALNCMRFLFMDSQLSGVVDQHAASSLKIAFKCFKSEIWAIRNCGIMLYTAIVNRIFPKDGTAQIFKSDRFFQRYPGLDSVFLDTLSDGFKDLNDHRLIESVYPALDILSRLTFIQCDDMDAMDKTEALNEVVVKYIGCKIWKIREAAAKSISAFIPSQAHAVALMRYFLEWNFARGPRDNNAMHGGLCAAREIYERKLSNGSADVRKEAISLIQNSTDLYLESKKVSPICQAHFIQLCGVVCGQQIEYLNDKIVPFCQKVMAEAQGMAPRTFAHSMLHIEIAKILGSVVPSVAVSYLAFNDPDYGISLSETLTKLNKKIDLSWSIDKLRTGLDPNNQTEVEVTEASESMNTSIRPQSQEMTAVNLLQAILNSHDWEQYRVAAVNMLLLDSTSGEFLPSGLATMAAKGVTEPLRESALVLLGKNLLLSPRDDEIEDNKRSIPAWIAQLYSCTKDEQPYSSRMAALRSIDAGYPFLKETMERLGASKSDPTVLHVFLVLHRLLNDDEVDIRVAAGDMTMRLLHPGAVEVIPTISLHAERKLFSYLASIRAWEYIDIERVLLQSVLGVPIGNPDEIKKLLVAANAPNTLLFKVEKQNLYRDDLRCMEYYLGLLCNHNSTNTSQNDLVGEGFADSLADYVCVGIETLWDIAQEYQVIPDHDGGVSLSTGKLRSADGIMGWSTSTEEMFVLGMRVANAFQLLVSWDLGLAKQRTAVDIVRRFVDYGSRDDVKLNQEWLKAFRRGIGN